MDLFNLRDAHVRNSQGSSRIPKPSSAGNFTPKEELLFLQNENTPSELKMNQMAEGSLSIEEELSALRKERENSKFKFDELEATNNTLQKKLEDLSKSSNEIQNKLFLENDKSVQLESRIEMHSEELKQKELKIENMQHELENALKLAEENENAGKMIQMEYERKLEIVALEQEKIIQEKKEKEAILKKLEDRMPSSSQSICSPEMPDDAMDDDSASLVIETLKAENNNLQKQLKDLLGHDVSPTQKMKRKRSSAMIQEDGSSLLSQIALYENEIEDFKKKITLTDASILSLKNDKNMLIESHERENKELKDKLINFESEYQGKLESRIEQIRLELSEQHSKEMSERMQTISRLEAKLKDTSESRELFRSVFHGQDNEGKSLPTDSIATIIEGINPIECQELTGDLQTKCAFLQETVNRLSEDKTSLEDCVKSHSGASAIYLSEIESLQVNLQSREEAIKKYQYSVRELTEETVSLKQELSQLSSIIEINQSALEAFAREQSKLAETTALETEEKNKERQAKDEQIIAMKSVIEQLEATLSAYQMKLQTYKSQSELDQDTMDELVTELERKDAELIFLKNSLMTSVETKSDLQAKMNEISILENTIQATDLQYSRDIPSKNHIQEDMELNSLREELELKTQCLKNTMTLLSLQKDEILVIRSQVSEFLDDAYKHSFILNDNFQRCRDHLASQKIEFEKTLYEKEQLNKTLLHKNEELASEIESLKRNENSQRSEWEVKEKKWTEEQGLYQENIAKLNIQMAYMDHQFHEFIIFCEHTWLSEDRPEMTTEERKVFICEKMKFAAEEKMQLRSELALEKKSTECILNEFNDGLDVLKHDWDLQKANLILKLRQGISKSTVMILTIKLVSDENEAMKMRIEHLIKEKRETSLQHAQILEFQSQSMESQIKSMEIMKGAILEEVEQLKQELVFAGLEKENFFLKATQEKEMQAAIWAEKIKEHEYEYVLLEQKLQSQEEENNKLRTEVDLMSSNYKLNLEDALKEERASFDAMNTEWKASCDVLKEEKANLQSELDTSNLKLSAGIEELDRIKLALVEKEATASELRNRLHEIESQQKFEYGHQEALETLKNEMERTTLLLQQKQSEICEFEKAIVIAQQIIGEKDSSIQDLEAKCKFNEELSAESKRFKEELVKSEEEQQVLQKQIIILDERIADLTEQIRLLQNSNDNFEKELAVMVESKTILEASVKEKEESLAIFLNEIDELKKNHENQLNSLTEEIEKKEFMFETVREEKENMSTTMMEEKKSLAREIEALQLLGKEGKQENEMLQKEIEFLKEEKEKIEREKERIEKEREIIHKEIQKQELLFAEKLAVVEKEMLAKTETHLSELKQALEQKQSDLAALKSNFECDLAKIVAENEVIRGEMHDLSKNLAIQQEENSSQRNEMESLLAENKSLIQSEKELAKWKLEFEAERIKAESLSSELAKLTNQKHLMRQAFDRPSSPEQDELISQLEERAQQNLIQFEQVQDKYLDLLKENKKLVAKLDKLTNQISNANESKEKENQSKFTQNQIKFAQNQLETCESPNENVYSQENQPSSLVKGRKRHHQDASPLDTRSKSKKNVLRPVISDLNLTERDDLISLKPQESFIDTSKTGKPSQKSRPEECNQQ